jgi:hypothetical protein
MKNPLKPLFLVGTTLSLVACLGSNDSSTSSERVMGSANIQSDPCAAELRDTVGCFTEPFSEPWGPSAMKAMAEQPATDDSPFASLLTPKGNLKNPIRQLPQDDRCLRMADGRPTECKPAAGSIALLPDDRVLYFNALEGTEDAEFSIFFEAGTVVTNDQTRVMSLSGKTAGWMRPSPVNGGANPDGYEATLLLPKGLIDNTDASTNNDGALFCADLEMLADGRVMAVGGTDYYFEPGIQKPIAIGVSELEGVRNARVFDFRDNSWKKTGDMTYGRWYPSLTTLSNGDILVSSGVTKLIKPIYPERPETSGRNVTQTETYDLGCGTWTENGPLAERSLPLYPRQHLLPNGHVLYNAGGQAFNPFGQSYDQAIWNIIAAYDPEQKLWTDLGYAGLPLKLNQVGLDRLGSALNPTNTEIAADLEKTLTGLLGSVTEDPASLLMPFLDSASKDPEAALMSTLGSGFRGSTFSIQMPLRPNAQGRYDHAEFLTAGGVLGAITATSPGSYVTTNLSRIDRINIANDNTMAYESRLTGSLTKPRWYGTGVLLPTGEVMVFSGADRDEVLLPGSGAAILDTEIFDPKTETWRVMARQKNPRTYHNTAMLLPDGRVLVGGHSPINTGYAFSLDLTALGLSPNQGRDPSFEIYSPPYVFAENRPKITSAPKSASHGQTISVNTKGENIKEVLLVKRTTLTHIIDGDQRTVVLPHTGTDKLNVTIPTQKGALPPGSYMLFVVSEDANGKRLPSVSVPMTIEGADNRAIGCNAPAPRVAKR